MTVGEKIRKYRTMMGMTQKELGAEALKGKLNAGVRINQYEKDMAVPGEDIKAKLAAVLDIDIDALSDVNIKSDEDFMFALFELEEQRGLKVSKENGKIHLVFDAPDNENFNEHLTTYLNFWANEAAKERNTDEEKAEYMQWKAKLPSNVKKYLADKEEAVNRFYGDIVKAYKREKNYATDTADISRLLKMIVDSGLTLSTGYGENKSAGYSFAVNELLNPPSPDAKELFGRFLSEIEHFRELGANCNTEVSLPGDTLQITYYVPVPALMIIKSQIDKYLSDIKKPDRPDWVIEMDDEDFENGLEDYHCNIEEEIAFFCGK